MSLRLKLSVMVTSFCLLICCLLTITFLAMEALSAVRTYINGEALWSKAHKDAIYFLTRYAFEYDPNLYKQFELSLKVIEGYNRARLALEKAKPDFDDAKRGFIEGGTHPDDVWGASLLFVYSRPLEVIDQAIGLWKAADGEIDILRQTATELHRLINSGDKSHLKIQTLLQQIAAINTRITFCETRFSAILGEAARRLKYWLILVSCLLTLLSIAASIWVLRFFSGQWLRNIDSLSTATRKVSAGEFGYEVDIEGRDELSHLSKAFNQMSHHLRALTEQRDLIEKSLAQRAEQLSDAQAITKLGNWEWDSYRKVFEGSEEFRKILELDIEQTCFNDVEFFARFEPEHQRVLGKLLSNTLANATSANCECRVLLDNGDYRSIFFRMRGVASTGKVLGTLQDVTDIQKLQMSLIQSSRMASLGEMSSGVAHEINNPLSIISARATQLRRLLSERGPDLKKAEQYLNSIEGVTERIATIVRSLRAYANSGEGDPYTSVNIQTLISSSLSLCGERLRNKGINLKVEEFDPALTVECRAAQISQVLLNLLRNAEYAVMKHADRNITIGVEEIGDYIHIGVSNSGDRIPQSIAERIFQPFFTTKDVGEGTGLGLSIAKGIVEEHGGQIDLVDASEDIKFVFQLRKQHAIHIH